jgi:hypothetical protein
MPKWAGAAQWATGCQIESTQWCNVVAGWSRTEATGLTTESTYLCYIACWLCRVHGAYRGMPANYMHACAGGARLHLDLVGDDAVVQLAHVVLLQVRAVVDAPVVLQEVLRAHHIPGNITPWAACHCAPQNGHSQPSQVTISHDHNASQWQSCGGVPRPPRGGQMLPR